MHLLGTDCSRPQKWFPMQAQPLVCFASGESANLCPVEILLVSHFLHQSLAPTAAADADNVF